MSNYGLVLGCKNLQKMKRFYTDFLRLGNPSVDSVDWVEYEDDETGLVIALQEFPNKGIESSNIFCIYTSDYGEIVEKLLEEKLNVVYKRELTIVEKHQFFKDIEGNIFALIEKG